MELKIVFTFLLLIGLSVVFDSNSKLLEGNDVDPFSLNNLDLMDFLSVVSGEIKLGNHTIRLPQDLPKLFGMDGGRNHYSQKADRRSYQEEDPRLKIKIKPWGEEKQGWGWGDDKKGDGLISVSNFFRLGCILFDLKEIKASADNGLFGDKVEIKIKDHHHHGWR